MVSFFIKTNICFILWWSLVKYQFSQAMHTIVYPKLRMVTYSTFYISYYEFCGICIIYFLFEFEDNSKLKKIKLLISRFIAKSAISKCNCFLPRFTDPHSLCSLLALSLNRGLCIIDIMINCKYT